MFSLLVTHPSVSMDLCIDVFIQLVSHPSVSMDLCIGICLACLLLILLSAWICALVYV